mgnify:CR=1 FL=1
MLAVAGVAVFLLWREVYPDLETAARYAIFNVVSIATTTGYANTDYNQWPIFAPVLMLFLLLKTYSDIRAHLLKHYQEANPDAPAQYL